jgi:hypothetical protein
MLGKLCRLEKQCGRPPAHPEKLPTLGVLPGAPKPVKAFLYSTSTRASELAMLTRRNARPATLPGGNNSIGTSAPSFPQLGNNREKSYRCTITTTVTFDYGSRFMRHGAAARADRREQRISRARCCHGRHG